MQILVVAATEMEIRPFRNQFPNSDFIITGVGVSATVYELTKKITTRPYELIIQVGIAGTNNDMIQIGEAVIVKDDCFADLGVLEKGKLATVFELGFSLENEVPYKNGRLYNPNIDSFQHKQVSAITVNLITDDTEYRAIMINKYQSDIESMEGAAFHYVCLRENVPFLQIRGISNEVGDRDKSNWKIIEAINTSNELLCDIYKKCLNN